jgi:DNA-binding beta-propeller fold protein YncE
MIAHRVMQPQKGWNLKRAVYSSVFFGTGSQETNPNAIYFKPDGTKMYVLGTVNDTVYQYTLSIPWVVSSATYDSVSFSVAGQETIPSALFFKPDGTKMYVAGSNDRIYQYSLSSAWVVSSATYDTVNLNVGAVIESSIQAIAFKADGTKAYVLGFNTDTVHQYSLSGAWDLATGSYDSVSISIAAQELEPAGLFFRPDGKKMYVVGITNDTIYQYSLSSAWVVSSATYDSVSLSVSGQDGNPACLFFKPDGTKMYTAGIDNDRVYQYSLT